MKICIKCNVTKEINSFYNSTICIECINKCEGYAICKLCKLEKKLSEFYKKRSCKNGYLSKCSTCILNIRKEKYIPIISNNINIENELLLCNEFISTKLQKTNNVSDKLSLTFLYKYYILFLYSKGYKGLIIKEEFKNKISEDFGEYKHNKWSYIKII